MAHIGELPPCPATPAFPGRLCISPNSVARVLAGIHAHTSCICSVLRSADGLKECERFVGPVVAVLVVVVELDGEGEGKGKGEGRASAVEVGSMLQGPLLGLC